MQGMVELLQAISQTATLMSPTAPSALLNLLSEAERALAFAHELKASIPADKAIAHDRKLQLSKLRRAFSYAEQLQHLSVDPAIAARLSKRATAEIAVYYLGIRAER